MVKIRVEHVLGKPIDEVFEGLADHASYRRFAGFDASRLRHDRGEITLTPVESKMRIIWISEGRSGAGTVRLDRRWIRAALIECGDCQ